MQGIEELAHAKVNLFLRVLRRREDGFHEIETFMAPITLCDSLELESANAFEFRCDEPGLAGDDNLVVRAACLFFSETNRAPKVRLTLRKEIPHGAGLGGGSSDAAAALRGLNRFCDAGLSSEKLRTLGAQLGSDVSFVAAEARIRGPEFLGLFTLAGYARSCGRNLSIAKIRRHHLSERSGTPC